MNPELEEGNVEYKLKLLDKTEFRIEKLASQMAYRCNEGNSECIYNLGVSDEGELIGINEIEYKETLENLKKAAKINDYSILEILKTQVKKTDKYIYELLIRENNIKKYIDVKVAIAGSVDVGKSSLIGVLTSGKNDNGRGKARTSVFNFPHEIKSGRTSSISQQILGFDSEGKIVNYRDVGRMSWPDIVKASSKIISFFDLAGHEKYLKTTILGLSSSKPDICMIIVGANKGLLRMTKEHIFLCMSLKIPFIIVITKLDIIKNNKNVFTNSFNSIIKLIKHPVMRRVPVKVKNKDDVITCSKNIHSESIVPIFKISNVSGEGIQDLKLFLNLTQKRKSDVNKNDVKLYIDSCFSVQGVGTVVGGHLLSGNIKVGDRLLMGPNKSKYKKVVIRSIHCKRVNLQSVDYGSYVCLALKKIDKEEIRKGSVLISENNKHLLVKNFIADINVLKLHSTTIRIGYEPIIHCGAVRQTGKLIEILEIKKYKDNDKNVLRIGDKAKVKFKFSFHPENVSVGDRILLCEGRTKIIGIITQLNK